MYSDSASNFDSALMDTLSSFPPTTITFNLSSTVERYNADGRSTLKSYARLNIYKLRSRGVFQEKSVLSRLGNKELIESGLLFSLSAHPKEMASVPARSLYKLE